MSKKKKWIYNSKIAAKAISVAVGFLCLNCLWGCGVQDKAIVLLNEETQQNEVACGEELEAGKGLTATDVIDMEMTAEMSGIARDSIGNATEVFGDGTRMQEPAKIYVHVCGAVVSPGVVELPEGSRVEAALLAAGGFDEAAAKDYVNLASKIEDGQQLYFPTMEEAEALLGENGSLFSGMGAGISTSQGAAQGTDKVNINTADVSLLCTLPGIGEARALDIIAYREAHGAFQRIEDIMQVSGIKQNAFDKISDKIMVQ